MKFKLILALVLVIVGFAVFYFTSNTNMSLVHQEQETSIENATDVLNDVNFGDDINFDDVEAAVIVLDTVQ